MRHLLAALLCLTLLWPSTRAQACGYDDPNPDDPTAHPENFSAFAEGRLGLLLPTYRPAYLAFAWRVMQGTPTTPEERRTLLETWSLMEGSTPPGDVEREMQRWLDARTAALRPKGESPEELTARRDAIRRQALLIHGDAFERAAEAVQSLSRLWKKHPELVAEWISAQDALFEGDCEVRVEDGTEAEAAPAPKLPKEVQSRREAEHDYQSAASHLYCGRFDEALAAFRRISEQAGSPYRTRAAYLVARTQVRRALMTQAQWNEQPPYSPTADQTALFTSWLTEADATIETLLATRASREFHGPARRLRSLIRLRTQPETWACELPTLVLQPGTGSALAAELRDFNRTFNPSRPCASSPASVREMFDWIRAMYGPSRYAPTEEERTALRREVVATAMKHWEARHQPLWLIPALLHSQVGDPHLDVLLAATAEVPAAAPVGVMLALYSVRLMREQGLTDAAYARLSKVSPDATTDFPISDGLLREERIRLARSWDEAIFYARPRLVGEGEPSHPGVIDWERPETRFITFSWQASNILEPQLTTHRMGELAHHPLVPPSQRRGLRWTTFVRAAVMGDDETLQRMAKELAQTEPPAREELLTLVSRKTPEERLFEARLLIMGLSRVSTSLLTNSAGAAETDLTRVASWSQNWWCTTPAESSKPRLRFVSEEEHTEAGAERKKLSEAGSAVVFFSNVALAWAKAHPDDPRAPIALYRAVRSSKHGCEKETRAARDAFRYLHKHYGKSTWAKRVPYVY
ncbi:hypothetical protein LZ198_27660 [Myxococcus sp. K15C18031901]|uniref:hypothetical protein n=1 Tax=Myxococcus dinghuensis TaxID=2906761 RepID=UPI0020A7345A|nr:hypothetical protein [Myxococcus dinghuensis]MCP3102658.1 hypothetical protein [Myxococcus dinghuensis]